ncbi:hypothetical protein AK812_SmicGene11814 [Symbiodinium microadriaticum]|uniref:Uncharacterized protein n=1 Tax=Symbiodinium microadriaticum TaxID=2951 RepID=A0A1Q9ECA5_SYMMI|nr:hypothetical protein AK812_SmicGene11814 [Symbiodinium microadriaticum]
MVDTKASVCTSPRRAGQGGHATSKKWLQIRGAVRAAGIARHSGGAGAREVGDKDLQKSITSRRFEWPSSLTESPSSSRGASPNTDAEELLRLSLLSGKLLASNQIPNLEWACTVCRCRNMDSVLLADQGFRIARLHGAAFLDAPALSSLLAASTATTGFFTRFKQTIRKGRMPASIRLRGYLHEQEARRPGLQGQPRLAGILAAVPVGAVDEALLEAGQGGGPELLTGPSCQISAGLEEEDEEGALRATGESTVVLVVDFAEDVVQHLSPYDPVTSPIEVQPFLSGSPPHLMLVHFALVAAAKEWLVTLTGERMAFYSAAEEPEQDAINPPEPGPKKKLAAKPKRPTTSQLAEQMETMLSMLPALAQQVQEISSRQRALEGRPTQENLCWGPLLVRQPAGLETLGSFGACSGGEGGLSCQEAPAYAERLGGYGHQRSLGTVFCANIADTLVAGDVAGAEVDFSQPPPGGHYHDGSNGFKTKSSGKAAPLDFDTMIVGTRGTFGAFLASTLQLSQDTPPGSSATTGPLDPTSSSPPPVPKDRPCSLNAERLKKTGRGHWDPVPFLDGEPDLAIAKTMEIKFLLVTRLLLRSPLFSGEVLIERACWFPLISFRSDSYISTAIALRGTPLCFELIASVFARGLSSLMSRREAREAHDIEVYGLESALVNDLAQTLRWKTESAWTWDRPKHINCLEAGAFRRLCFKKAHGSIPSRFASLIDSNVARCAISKGRSPSGALTRELRQVGAVCVAFGLFGALPFCPTRLMPADGPSRGTSTPEPLPGTPLQHRCILQLRSERLPPFHAPADGLRIGFVWSCLCAGGSLPYPVIATPRCLLFSSGLLTWILMPLLDFPAKALPCVTEQAFAQSCSDDVDLVNALLARYGRALYESGRPYNHYAETVNAVAGKFPKIRRLLQPAWDVAFQWQKLEPHIHHQAMPWQVLLALVTAALLWGWVDVAGVLALAWGGLARIGEIFAAFRCDLVLPSDIQYTVDYILLAVREPKTRNTAARHQALRLDQPQLIMVVEHQL